MSARIISKPSNDKYREGWDRIFKWFSNEPEMASCLSEESLDKWINSLKKTDCYQK